MSERFVEIAVGSVSRRGLCVNVKEIGKEILHCQSQNYEMYRSHYFFDESLKDHLRTYKTVRGYLGVPIIDSIVMDVDKGSDSDELVHQRAKEVFYKLKELYEIEDINIRPHYSGTGFHIVIPNLFNFKTHEEVQATMKHCFPELDTIYDKTRLIRVNNTINYKTKRYKIPLEHKEFLNYSIAEIIEASQQPRNSFEWPAFELDNSLEQYKKEAPTVLLNNPKNDDGYSPIVTCMQKLYTTEPKQGMRHIAMLRMVSAYKRGGVPRAGIEVMMMQWARGQMEIGEVRKIVGDVFNKNYSYSCNDEIMHQWCDQRCMFYKTKSYNAAQPEDSVSMEERMKIFAMQGDTNVIINFQKPLHLKTPFLAYKKEFVVLLGDTGLGKSALMQFISTEAKSRKVLYLNFEMGETLAYRRFLQQAHGLSKEQVIDHYLQPNPPSLAGPIQHIKMISSRITLHAFEQLISSEGYEIVVVDTLECFNTPGVTEITPKTELIAHEMRRIVDRYNLLLVAIHHVSKGSIVDPNGGKKRLNSHSGKGSGAVEQQADKVIVFEGEADKPLRNVRSTKARDEIPFNIWLHFDAANTFRFYKLQEEKLLTSSESTDQTTDTASKSSMLYHSLQS